MLQLNTANNHVLKHKLPECSGSLHRYCSGAAVSMPSLEQDTVAKLIGFKDKTNESKCLSPTVDALTTGISFIGMFTVVSSTQSIGNQWLSHWERLATALVSIMQIALSLHHPAEPC